MKVVTTDQVTAFIRNLAPEPRKRLKAGMTGLRDGLGDIKQLEDNLAGYSRLRVGSFRVIFQYRDFGIVCVFVERRKIVYEVFSSLVEQGLLSPDKGN